MNHSNTICYLRLLAGDTTSAGVAHDMALIACLRLEREIHEHVVLGLPLITEIRVSADITVFDVLQHVLEWHSRCSGDHPGCIIAGFALIGINDDIGTAMDRTQIDTFNARPPGVNHERIRYVGARPARVEEQLEGDKIRLVEVAPAHPHGLVVALDEASMDLEVWLDAHRRTDFVPHCGEIGVEPNARASVVWADGHLEGYNCVHLEGYSSLIPPPPGDLSPGLALLWKRAAGVGESAAQEDC